MREDIKELIEQNMNELHEEEENNSIHTLQEQINKQNKLVHEQNLIREYLKKVNKNSIEELTEEEQIKMKEIVNKE